MPIGTQMINTMKVITTKDNAFTYACLVVIHFVLAYTMEDWVLAAGVAKEFCNERVKITANNHGSMPNCTHVWQRTGVKITKSTML